MVCQDEWNCNKWYRNSSLIWVMHLQKIHTYKISHEISWKILVFFLFEYWSRTQFRVQKLNFFWKICAYNILTKFSQLRHQKKLSDIIHEITNTKLDAEGKSQKEKKKGNKKIHALLKSSQWRYGKADSRLVSKMSPGIKACNYKLMRTTKRVHKKSCSISQLARCRFCQVHEKEP